MTNKYLLFNVWDKPYRNATIWCCFAGNEHREADWQPVYDDDPRALEKFTRVYRGSERLLVCTGEYGSMGDNRRTWNLEGDNKENPPPHFVALLNLIAPLPDTGLNGEDEEWLFTKDEWIGMNAGCPELLELASYIKE